MNALTPFEAEVAEVIRQCVAELADGWGRVERKHDPASGQWWWHIVPTRRDALTVEVGVEGDELVVQLGRAHFELWRSRRHSPLDELAPILRAVFAGDVVEAGWREDGFARIRLEDGRVLSVGSVHLPWPWRCTYRYFPY